MKHASACGVGKDDALALVEQEDRHRRPLEQGVEQELALDQFGALLAQDRTHPVEDGHQVADLVGRGRCQTRREVALGKTRDAVVQRAQRLTRG